jgi:hypothetical protein
LEKAESSPFFNYAANAEKTLKRKLQITPKKKLMRML